MSLSITTDIIEMASQSEILARHMNAFVERGVRESLERLEGAIPSHEELAKHGRFIITSDGSKWFVWKGYAACVFIPPAFGSLSFTWKRHDCQVGEIPESQIR